MYNNLFFKYKKEQNYFYFCTLVYTLKIPFNYNILKTRSILKVLILNLHFYSILEPINLLSITPRVIKRNDFRVCVRVSNPNRITTNMRTFYYRKPNYTERVLSY